MSLIVVEINPIVRGPQQFRRRSSAYEKTAGINSEGPFRLELARASASEGNIAGRISAFGGTEPNLRQLSRTR
ncbi:putative type I restriction-modification system S subunit [Burkholderia sp. ABCPW 111]|nr:putative type I restriction-modification system S subunit [Burkholderia sp. ABCPW 111]